MAETWREACWKAEQEVAEYRGTIIPAMAEKLRELRRTADELEEANRNLARALRVAERERDAAERMCLRLDDELCFTRSFVHRHGLEWTLAGEWNLEKDRRRKPEQPAEAPGYGRYDSLGEEDNG